MKLLRLLRRTESLSVSHRWINAVCWLVLGAGGLGAGVMLYTWLALTSNLGRVTLEPGTVEFASEVAEGDAPIVQLQVRNASRVPIVVQRVTTACACTTATTRGEMPVTIPPQSSLPWEVRVDTAHRAGLMETGVDFSLADSSAHAALSATIRLHIRPGWRVSLASMEFHDVPQGVPIHRTIELFDGFPDPGIRLEGIKISDSRYIHVDELPRQKDEIRAGTVKTDGVTFHKRASLAVTFVPPNRRGLIEESVVLHADRRSQEPIRIPITCSIQGPEIEARPDEVYLVLEPAHATLTRTVRCTLRDPKLGTLRVTNTPPFIKTELVKRDERVTDVVVTIDTGRLGQRSFETDLVVGAGTHPSTCRIPIRGIVGSR